jgi:RND superfamily putative drug exporter
MDYALLVVTRFREESARVSSIECAVTRTMRTAGRTVVLSGLTIAVSLPALLIINVGLFSSIAIGGIVASLTAVLVATTVLPAVLRLFGQHIDRLSLAFAVRAAHRGTLWRRVAALVTSHPGTAALLSSAVLLALAVPAHSLRLDFRNVSALPSKDPITREVGTISNVFGAGASGVVEVVTRDPLQRSISILWQAPHMRSIWQVVKGTGGWTAIYALLKVAPDSDEAHQTITRMRQLFADHKNDTFVGGVTASEMDLTQRVAERMPIAIAIAVLVSLLTLALGLRSIVIPLIAVLCSVLSVSATLGVLLLLFPSAGGADRLAFFVPLVIFILVLGLANDYEVFLLSRVREAARTGMSTKTSVSHALQQTGRPITLAGYTVAAIFVAFCFSSLEAMRQLGVGVAVGVALDVSLIRCVLVPALTVLLGPWNWWLPRLRGIAPT